MWLYLKHTKKLDMGVNNDYYLSVSKTINIEQWCLCTRCDLMGLLGDIDEVSTSGVEVILYILSIRMYIV